MLMPMVLERALRWSDECHRRQTRKGGETAYFTHLAGVALILQRHGFDDEVVVAGLLHDVVEDTAATLDDVRDRFGPNVADLVRWCSEIKLDDQGHKLPWIKRKRDHLAALAGDPHLALAAAPRRALAVILADKLHNLVSMACDLRDGRHVWLRFNAERDQVLWYYHAVIDSADPDDPLLKPLADECRRVLARIEAPDDELTDADACRSVATQGENPRAAPQDG